MQELSMDVSFAKELQVFSALGPVKEWTVG
jgi:hypothetical protein